MSVKQQQLDGKLKVLSDIDKEILAKHDVDSIEREIEESETVSAKILECKQHISVAIKSTAATTAPTAMALIVTTTYDKLKLPKLTLPRFKGGLTTWTTFGIYSSPQCVKTMEFRRLINVATSSRC